MKTNAAVIILYDRAKRFLLQHRSEDAGLMPGYWAFFGGEIKEGETPAEAVSREAREELKYKTKSPELVIEQDFSEGDTGGRLHVYIEAFYGDKSALKLQEGQGWGWFENKNMRGLKMTDRDRQINEFITRYLKKKNKMRNKEMKLDSVAREVRKLVIDVACKSRTPHVGSSLSCVDLLVSLYFHELKIGEESWDDRDIFILSKAHAALALYAVFAAKGIITRKTFEGYLQNDGSLPAHLDRFAAKGIEASAGALGHGFNMALGMAYGYKCKKDKRRIFTLIGDGESQEGSIWEGALFASKLGIDNLTAILDYNNLQGYGRPTEICHYEPVADKWKAFGWETCEVDGHDFRGIMEGLKKPNNGKPKIIIAKTLKGKGVSFMEDELKWHYFIVTEELKEKAMKELSGECSEKKCYKKNYSICGKG
jgi:transketolase